MEYPHLFREGSIGKVTIRNRVAMAPMVTGMAGFDGNPTEQLIQYYEERARNGLGLLITGATQVNIWFGGAAAPRQLSMAYDRHIAPFAAMVERVHAHGTKVFCQLHHPGNEGMSLMGIAGPQMELLGRIWPGIYGVMPKMMQMTGRNPELSKKMMEWMMEHWKWPAVVGPSGVPCEFNNQRTRALKKFEVKRLVRDYARAAKRVQLAGGDGVELHAAHGYLIEQFLSPHTNRRTDEYGGSLENRMRFAREIIASIRELCGRDFPVMVRLSADEFYRYIGHPGRGIELEEGVEIARLLEKAGIDAINVSSGTYETCNWAIEPCSFEPGWRKHLAAAVKEAVEIPVLAANLIRSPEQAEAQLAEGIQDFAVLGRPFLADGAWARKAEEGRPDEIKRCIMCLYCFESLLTKLTVECAVNPRLGREKETAEPRVDGNGRTVAVVGAGPAGLAAAEALCARGFKPVVLERSDGPGGQLKLGSVPPGKDKIFWCVDDLENAARRGGTDIRYNTEATVQVLEALDLYAVLVATGGMPVIPNIPGVDRDFVCTVDQVLDGTVALKGKHVAVIGSGLTGLETALKLVEEGNRVMVVEMASEIGPGAYVQNLDDVMLRLKLYNPVFITSHKLVEIREGRIVLEHVKSGDRATRQVDQVVLSVGVKGDDALAKELKGRFPRVKVIGDAHQVGRIGDAVRDGFDAARDL